MGKRRNFHTTRRFEDGMYRFLSSHSNISLCESQMHRYGKVTRNRLRHFKSRDGKYHIYEKIDER